MPGRDSKGTAVTSAELQRQLKRNCDYVYSFDPRFRLGLICPSIYLTGVERQYSGSSRRVSQNA